MRSTRASLCWGDPAVARTMMERASPQLTRSRSSVSNGLPDLEKGLAWLVPQLVVLNVEVNDADELKETQYGRPYVDLNITVIAQGLHIRSSVRNIATGEMHACRSKMPVCQLPGALRGRIRCCPCKTVKEIETQGDTR